MDTPSKQEFSSQLRLPPGHTAPPVLEGVSRPSAQCSILETGVGGVYSVELGGLEGCGVRECIEQGETWLCLLIRLPLLQGLFILSFHSFILSSFHPFIRSSFHPFILSSFHPSFHPFILSSFHPFIPSSLINELITFNYAV